MRYAIHLPHTHAPCPSSPVATVACPSAWPVGKADGAYVPVADSYFLRAIATLSWSLRFHDMFNETGRYASSSSKLNAVDSTLSPCAPDHALTTHQVTDGGRSSLIGVSFVQSRPSGGESMMPQTWAYISALRPSRA